MDREHRRVTFFIGNLDKTLRRIEATAIGFLLGFAEFEGVSRNVPKSMCAFSLIIAFRECFGLRRDLHRIGNAKVQCQISKEGILLGQATNREVAAQRSGEFSCRLSFWPITAHHVHNVEGTTKKTLSFYEPMLVAR